MNRSLEINQTKGIQVIGAGFGRTGTSSFREALNILGYNCYHMSDVSNVRKSLKVAVNVEEYAYFLINEAYK